MIRNFKRLSGNLRKEQTRLIAEAANCDMLPSEGVRRKIAELELNICAVDNNIHEMETRKTA
jgi:hypothetical protein